MWAEDLAEQIIEELAGMQEQRLDPLRMLAAIRVEIRLDQQRDRDRKRMERRRRIARGERGFVMEERVCLGCGEVFAVLVGGVGRPKQYHSVECENATAQKRWRHRRKGNSVRP
jgi:hypothetical protein